VSEQPCEYCGAALPQGVDKSTRQIRSRHFQSCDARPKLDDYRDTEIKRLEAERDALKADAERYRYLRKHCYKQKWPNSEFDRAMHLSFTVSGIWANNHDPEVLDGCIDTAREVKP
jgi:hypothetical protein